MTSMEWLESMVKGMVENGGDLGEDYHALMMHIEKAKEMYKAEQEELLKNNKPKSNLIQRLCKRDKYYNFICDFTI
jgi:hypothetical protein